MGLLCVKMTKYIESTLTPIYILLKVHYNTQLNIVIMWLFRASTLNINFFLIFSNFNKDINLFFLKEILGPNTLGWPHKKNYITKVQNHTYKWKNQKGNRIIRKKKLYGWHIYYV